MHLPCGDPLTAAQMEDVEGAFLCHCEWRLDKRGNPKVADRCRVHDPSFQVVGLSLLLRQVATCRPPDLQQPVVTGRLLPPAARSHKPSTCVGTSPHMTSVGVFRSPDQLLQISHTQSSQNVQQIWAIVVLSTPKRQDKTRQDKTRQDKTRQDKTRQDKTRQDKTRQDKTRQDKTRQDKTRQDRTGQDRTRRDKT